MFRRGSNTEHQVILPKKLKTTAGCLTCRVRRIKCGEEQPSCKRCTSTGRSCDWYPASLVSKASPPSPPIATLLQSGQERRSFDFFCQCTVPQLGGVYGSEFWQRLVLQATQHESSIRHAVVALGSVHESYQNDANASTMVDTEFAFRQYSKAINALVDPIRHGEKQAADVTLISCVLFVLLETLRGNHGAARAHLKSGVEIVLALVTGVSPFATSSIPYAPLRILNDLFVSLDNPPLAVGTWPNRRLLRFDTDANNRLATSIPIMFSSLDEAHHVLADIRTEGVRAVQNAFAGSDSSPTHPAVAKVTLATACSTAMVRIKQWHQALENLKSTMGHVTDPLELEALHLLKLHPILCKLSFSIDPIKSLSDELVWDEFTPQFEAAVGYAADAMEVQSITRSRQPLFRMDSGVILSLYFMALKCRQHVTRMRAVELLKKHPRHGGMWNSWLTARVAEKLIALEEEGLQGKNGADLEPDDVPAWKRVNVVQVKFSKEGRSAILMYKRSPSKDSAAIWIEELMEW